MMRIGISGYAGAGKDEVAHVLEKWYGYERIAMSDALHEYMLQLDPLLASGVTYSRAIETYGYVKTKKIFPEARRLLQVLGTEVGRAIDPYMWVKERDKRMTTSRCVTTGIRFVEEIEHTDFLIWVDRPGYGPVNGHVSDDIAWIRDLAEATIDNSGTLRDLDRQVEALMLDTFGAVPAYTHQQQRIANGVPTGGTS